MTILVLVILAVIWAAVLLPPYLQNRSEARPADSISTFRNQLDTLERRANLAVPGREQRPNLPSSDGPRPLRPLSPTIDPTRLARVDARQRRRDILVTLLAAAGLTLVVSFLLPAALPLHLLIDVLLAAYVGLLLRAKRAAEERAVKVRYLNPARHQAGPAFRTGRSGAEQPALALRRTAAN
ncbi:MAG: hypothetical protein M3527_10570 [Actinomycetota bacterium]|nr:hypothetical protein [Acidimicrobiia bacterium]MDQ3294872.1 hypothetical protein [Actinomycetota bacterium]